MSFPVLMRWQAAQPLETMRCAPCAMSRWCGVNGSAADAVSGEGSWAWVFRGVLEPQPDSAAIVALASQRRHVLPAQNPGARLAGAFLCTRAAHVPTAEINHSPKRRVGD